MKVYRWQHKTLGVGPLCGMTSFDWEGNFKHHRFPSEDEAYNKFTKFFSDADMEDYFFAWDSLDKLLDVLKEGAEEELKRYGFELTIWEVTEDFVVLSDGQVLFNRAKSVILE